jgi:hypothetical protein
LGGREAAETLSAAMIVLPLFCLLTVVIKIEDYIFFGRSEMGTEQIFRDVGMEVVMNKHSYP